jgi:4-hydroxythreonine-4-phosphate dehydrogenase
MGDPAGVGPELCVRLLSRADVTEVCHPVVFGDLGVMESAALSAGIQWPADCAISEVRSSSFSPGPTIVDLKQIAPTEVRAGHISAATGSASVAYIEAAIAAAAEGRVGGVATCPIHKEAWHAAAVKYPGHTELFAERQSIARYCMMMTSPHFSCSLATTHVGYRDVPRLLTSELILEVTELTHEALVRILRRPPKLVMLGLNPHAGENGLFGNQEEERIIAPATKQALSKGIDIEGPIPPDTAFLPWRREQIDGFVCMYHDQGLIPFKAFNFDTGVNITLGLPIVRTSVDHGTALDIAWQGKAQVSSLVSAVQLAARLSL